MAVIGASVGGVQKDLEKGRMLLLVVLARSCIAWAVASDLGASGLLETLGVTIVIQPFFQRLLCSRSACRHQFYCEALPGAHGYHRHQFELSLL